VNTLPEPKKSILQSIRSKLLSLGYSEEAGYDAINIESYVAYSSNNKVRFFLKHKWEVVVIGVLQSEQEKQQVLMKFPSVQSKEFEAGDDNTFAIRFDPQNERELIFEVAEFFTR
jgi:hypothetical protein